jgi:hypothetical protein
MVGASKRGVELFATSVLFCVGVYLCLGVVVCTWACIWGLGQIDPMVAASRWGFRLLLVPSLIGLWPVVVALALKARCRRKGGGGGA